MAFNFGLPWSKQLGRRGRKPNSKAPARRMSFVPRLDVLEDRTVPSVSNIQGTMVVACDSATEQQGSNFINIGATVDIFTSRPAVWAQISDFNGVVEDFGMYDVGAAPGEVSSISASNSLAGGDSLRIDQTVAAAPLTVEVAAGLNFVDVGFPSQNLDNIQGPVAIAGNGGGLHLALFDDNAPSCETYQVTSSQVTRGGTAAITYSNVDYLQVFGGNFVNSVFNVLSTGANSATDIYYFGYSTINVGNGGSMQGIQTDLTLVAGGSATVNLDDSADTQGKPVTISHSAVTGLCQGAISYTATDISSLTIDGGIGGNIFTLSPTTQNLDELPGTNPGFQTPGSVTVNGGGNDTLILDDQNNTSPSVWTLTGNKMTRSHSSTIGQWETTITSSINYSGLANLTVNGGPGGNTFTVQDTAGGTNTTVNTGYGIDFVYVDATTGPLTVNTQGSTGSGFNGFEDAFVGAGADSLSGIQGPLTVNTLGRPGLDFATLALFDQATTAHETYTVTSNEVLRSGAAPINYRVTNQLEFHLGSGGNLVNILSTFPGLPEVFFGGLGDDTFNVGDDSNTLNGVQSNLFFQIATPSSQLILQDEGNSANINYTFAHDPAISPYNFVKRSHSGYYIVYSGPLQTLQLLAGSGDDSFTVRTPPPASTVVGLDGGGGTNKLDYSQYVGDIAVNLPLGTATGLTGGVSNIQQVHGSIGNDLLVGDGATELLSGGTGRNIIIAGASNAHLLGGGGDNILIGGATNFDQNMDALNDVMTEWLRTDLTFHERVADIRSGGTSVPKNKPPSVLKGTGFILNSRTVHDKSSANILTGSSGSGNSWFFWDPADDNLQNKKKGDVFTPIQ
jgi:hypothetical protein